MDPIRRREESRRRAPLLGPRRSRSEPLTGLRRGPRALLLALVALSALATYNTVFTAVRLGTPSQDATVTVPEVRITGVAGGELVLAGAPSPSGEDPGSLQSLLAHAAAEVLLAVTAAGALFLLFTESERGGPEPLRERRLTPGPPLRAPRVGESRSRARAVPAAAPAAEGSRSGSGSQRTSRAPSSTGPTFPQRAAVTTVVAAALTLILVAAPALALDNYYNQSGSPSVLNGTVVAGVPANLNLTDSVTYDVAETVLRTNFTETFGTSTTSAGSNGGFESGAAGQWVGGWYRQLSGTATPSISAYTQPIQSPSGTGLPAEGSWLYNDSTDVRSTANCAGADCITIQYGRNYTDTSLPYPMNSTKLWNFSAYIRTNLMREVGSLAADTDITAAGVTFNLRMNATSDIRYLHYYIFAIAQATPVNSSTDVYYFPFGTSSRCTEPTVLATDTPCTDTSWARLNVSNLSADIEAAWPGSTWSVKGIWFDVYQRFLNIRAGRTVILNASFDSLWVNDTSPHVEVVHNSTNATLPPGTVTNFLNATLNFTSNQSGKFQVDIFNHASGAYESCAVVQVAASAYQNFSCNVSQNPSNYVSPTGNITLKVNSTRNNTTDLLVQDYVQFRVNFSDLWPPNATGSGQNRTVVHKNETILINSTWTDYVGLRASSLETNATPAGFEDTGQVRNVTYNMSVTGTGNTSNFTLAFNLSASLGVKQWRIYANDTNDTSNINQTATGTFQLWGWANATNTTPQDNVSRGAVVTLTCRVRDHHNDSAIVGYNVSFYRDTGLAVFLGSNTTNSTGVARFDWNTAGAPGGYNFPTCVLESENSTLYYNASEQGRGNTSVFVRIPPSVTSSSPTGSTVTDSPLNSSRTFSVTVDQAVTVTWTINGTTVFTDPIGAGGTSIYANTSLASGNWNVTASASNANDTVTRAWTWIVNFPPSITSSSPVGATATNSPLDASRSFSVTVDQSVDVNWTLNGTSVRTASIGAGGTDVYTNSTLKSGTWNITATVNNSNGTATRTWTWIIYSSPNVTQCTPGGSPCPNNFSFFTSPTATVFGVTSDQAVNATWRINGSVVQTNSTPATIVNYTNTSPVAGTWNITVVVNNTNGTDNQTWLWTVFGAPTITDFQPSTPASNAANASRSFNLTADQTATVEWRINSTLVQTNTSVSAGTRAYYNNSSNVSGVWNITASVSNVNGTAQQVWAWTVAPDIISTSPASPVSDISSATRTFTADANQVVTFQWTINGATVQTNSSVTSASYTNTSAAVGTWNVTAAISNSNGSDQFFWTWEVSVQPVLRLIREQSNGTAANRVMTVDLYLVNPADSTSNATSAVIREFTNSTWAVQDCGGCAFNNSTFINWTVGNLDIDSYARVTYTVRAPSVTGFYLFSSNATFVTSEPQSVEAETDPWNVTVQSPRAMFEFELDLNRADSDINRTLSNSSNQSATWTATNIGDSPVPDGENLTLRLEYNGSLITVADPTCALCIQACSILTLAGSDRALECMVSNSSTAPGTVLRVNFTVNASITSADLVVTSNATYDPPVLSFGTYIPPPEVRPGQPPASVFEYVKPAPPSPPPEASPASESEASPPGPLEALWSWLTGLLGGGP